MKMRIIILTIFLIGLFFKSNGQETLVKGKVHNWITDTVYIVSLPFHSPYSTKTEYQIIASDSTFEHSLSDIKEPLVFFITSEKESVTQQIQSLLFDNLTDRHYYGHCIKTYTYGVTTYLIEPNEKIELELSFNSWIEELSDEKADKLRSYGVDVPKDNKMRNVGKTKIDFLNEDDFSLKYYQKSFNLDDKCDKTLERSKKIKSAIKNLKDKEQELLANLEMDKDKLSPFLFKYVKSEIEFGARKEFLKYLRFEHEKYMNNLFKADIPTEILEIVEFDEENIDYATLINEEYNEYLENYLNFKYSIKENEYVIYKQFNKEKFDFAMDVLPKISRYHYLANNLLQVEKSEEFKNLADILLTDYPDGGLNDKIIKKYQ
jgi:hypothetical protein